MSGRVGDLSATQEEKLAQLKASVADEPYQPPHVDDHFYLRWLRARNFKLDNAEKMLRNHLSFRQEMGADTVLEWTPPEVLTKCFPGGFFGEDREGHPVWYDNFGNLDFRGMHRSASKDDIIRLKVQHLERTCQICREFSEQKGRHVENTTSVIDVENLGYWQYYWPGISVFREILSLFNDNYPERTFRIIIIRAPRVFPAAFNMIRPFLNECTRDKIVILGSNWQEELQKYIHPDQLPQAFGGNRCEPDPQCTAYLNPGCVVPEQYYLTNLTATSKEDMERVIVGRGGSCEFSYQVQAPGTVLRWEFVSTDYDVAFGCLLKSSSHRRRSSICEEVVPVKRRNSHVVPESGAHCCTTIGEYVVKFDNSYSWARTKEVFYTVELLEPDGQLLTSDHTPSSDDDFEVVGTPLSDHTPSSEEGEEFEDCVGSKEGDLLPTTASA